VNASENKRRGILGFTMAEMMGVVAIIVILAAVAFPLIISMQKDLRMRELDDHAQQIYNAVQNRLSAIKASGAAFNEKDPENANTLYGAMTAGGARQQITTMPSDYNNSGERPWDK
jgi:Tfp pilus assembly protein FimT